MRSDRRQPEPGQKMVLCPGLQMGGSAAETIFGEGGKPKQRQLFGIPAREQIARPAKRTDYRVAYAQTETPLVIDNGTYHCRVGWAGEKEPVLDFRNLLFRPRSKATGEPVNIVGDYDALSAKGYDLPRASVRSAFDGNVVYQFETQETILDYAFERLGIEGSKVAHPILITECPGNPLYSRSKMAELMFEAYDVPALAFGVDGVFSHVHNRRKGLCGDDGLIINLGHSATHIIPMVGGEPLWSACCRVPIGGFHSTDFLKRTLCLQYPQHIMALTWELAEELKKTHCYVAEDFLQELRIYQDSNAAEAGGKLRWIQLPWMPLPEKEEPTEEALNRKAALREKQGQRLRELAAVKKAAKVAQLEAEVNSMEQLLQSVSTMSESQGNAVLSDAGYGSKAELQSCLSKSIVTLRKTKGEPVEEEDKGSEDPATTSPYPLLDIPDQELTPEQLKEKKKQRFLKNASEGRARAKQRKEEERLQKERERELEEERRIANPAQYLEEIKAKYTELLEKSEQRKKRKLASASGGNILGIAPSGRGERLTAAQKERMRLLTTAAFDKGKGEDTFGMHDADWLLYKKISKDGDDVDEDAEEEEVELARLAARLQELGASAPYLASAPGTNTILPSAGTLAAGAGPQGGISTGAPSVRRRLQAEDFQIPLRTERIRAAELVFQPSIIGQNQAGIGEAVSAVLQRVPGNLRQKVANGVFLITGGASLMQGMETRLGAEIRKVRPMDAPEKIATADNVVVDSWRGASALAASQNFRRQTFTKLDYDERGPDWLRKYAFKYATK